MEGLNRMLRTLILFLVDVTNLSSYSPSLRRTRLWLCQQPLLCMEAHCRRYVRFGNPNKQSYNGGLGAFCWRAVCLSRAVYLFCHSVPYRFRTCFSVMQTCCSHLLGQTCSGLCTHRWTKTSRFARTVAFFHSSPIFIIRSDQFVRMIHITDSTSQSNTNVSAAHPITFCMRSFLFDQNVFSVGFTIDKYTETNCNTQFCVTSGSLNSVWNGRFRLDGSWWYVPTLICGFQTAGSVLKARK